MSIEPNGKMCIRPWMVAKETVKLMKAITDNGDESRFVGGCVRDAVVNRVGSDIDIATIFTPEEIIERLKKDNIKYLTIGIDHGTITAIIDDMVFEITTLRKDVTTNGRHAEVSYTTSWEQDAKRRDFTMNAIFCDINGKIYDPCLGIADLRQGIVQFIGNAEDRMNEDILRLLRFFRFWAHFSKHDPSPETLKVCAKKAPELTNLSAERIQHEILKLLISNQAGKAWEYMNETNVSKYVLLPDTQNIKALKCLINIENKIHTSTYDMRRLSALLLGTKQDDIKGICKKLRLSNFQLAEVKAMTNENNIPKLNATEADIRRLVYTFKTHMARNLILMSAAKENSDNVIHIVKLYKMATICRLPPFPIEGKDVLKRGIPAGVRVGELLKEVENWWIDSDFKHGRTASLEKLTALIGSCDEGVKKSIASD